MTIDGRAFVGNTPVFRAKVGELVQWDVMAIGSDFHTFHVHGHRWITADGPRDTQTVGPAESFRVRWVEDAPGTWLYHCHVEDHMMRGMIGIYRCRNESAMRRLWILVAARGAALSRPPARALGRSPRRCSSSSRPTGRRSSTSCRDRRCCGRTSARARTPSPPTRGSSTPTTSVPISSFTFTFNRPGTYQYHCTIHSSIRGEVDVRRVILDTLPTAAVPVGDAVEFAGRTADPTRPIDIQRSAGREALRDDRPCEAASRRQLEHLHRGAGDGRLPRDVGRLGERDAAAAGRDPPRARAADAHRASASPSRRAFPMRRSSSRPTGGNASAGGRCDAWSSTTSPRPSCICEARPGSASSSSTRTAGRRSRPARP